MAVLGALLLALAHALHAPLKSLLWRLPPRLGPGRAAALGLAAAAAAVWGRGGAVPGCGALAPILWAVAALHVLAFAALALPSALVGRLLLPREAPREAPDLAGLAALVDARRAEKARPAILLEEPVAEIPAHFAELAERLASSGGDGPAAAALVARAAERAARPDPMPALRLALGLSLAASAALAYAGDARACAAAGAALAVLALYLAPELRAALAIARERAVESALGERIGTGALVRRSEVEGMRTGPVWTLYGAALDLLWLGRQTGSEELGEAGREALRELEACYSSVETAKELWDRAERKRRFGAAW